jgi:sulfatase maturation enzyme AslB (radical SAM superfamily)
MFKLLYLPIWFFKTRILGKQIPLQSVLFISDKCNLQCKHCCVYGKSSNFNISTFEEVEKELEYCYNLGARFVDFEGGEPFIWKDDSNPDDVKDINSLFRLAKKIGFFSTTVTTNAQIDFSHCEADSIWVSLDGLAEYHDSIRGKGTFDRVIRNIAANSHKHLSVNMVVNKLNYPSVKETIEFAKDNEHIEMISINFHTPFPGTDDLELDWDVKNKVINEVIAMKKQGFPIMNSISGLKLMKHNNFKKYCWIANFILSDHTRYAQCQGKELGLCDRCGFCMAGEMNAIMSLRPDTIIAGMKLRM